MSLLRYDNEEGPYLDSLGLTKALESSNSKLKKVQLLSQMSYLDASLERKKKLGKESQVSEDDLDLVDLTPRRRRALGRAVGGAVGDTSSRSIDTLIPRDDLNLTNTKNGLRNGHREGHTRNDVVSKIKSLTKDNSDKRNHSVASSNSNDWNEQDRQVLDKDFPNLKLAHRVSPNDKFYISLQSDKLKYQKKSVKVAEPVDVVGEEDMSVYETDLPAVAVAAAAISSRLNEGAHKIASPYDSRGRSTSILSRTSSVPPANIANVISLQPDSMEEDSRDPSPTPLKRKLKKKEVTEIPSPLKRMKLIHSKESDEIPSPLKKMKLIRPDDEDDSSDSSSDTSEFMTPQNVDEEDDLIFGDVDKDEEVVGNVVNGNNTGNGNDTSDNTGNNIGNGDDTSDNIGNNTNNTGNDIGNDVSVKEDTFEENLPDVESADTSSTINSHPLAVTEADISSLKQQVLSRLTGQTPPIELVSLDDHYHQLYKLIQNTVTNQEGNSCLLMGASGTGKRSVVKKVIEDLESKYSREFITVRLSGAVQVDEKSAIRSIAQQIDLQISAFKQSEHYNSLKITDTRNSNKTLRALLSVLDQNEFSIDTKSLEQLSVAVVFIIEDFHRFTEYNRQSLLYNLLDLSQNSFTPICVIGLTTKITTREMLEKRVKSRFSQKIIMFNKPMSQELLIEQFLSNVLLKENEIDNHAYLKAYNSYVSKLAKTIGEPLHKYLVVNYYTIKNLNELLTRYMKIIFDLSVKLPFPGWKELLEEEDPFSNDLVRKIECLSDLELTLLLCCCRIVVKTELNVVDFNSCYEEYLTVMKSLELERISSMTNFDSGTGVVMGLKIWAKPNSKRAWDKLQRLGLLTSSTSSMGTSHVRRANQNQSFTTYSVVTTLEELKKVLDTQSPLYELTKL